MTVTTDTSEKSLEALIVAAMTGAQAAAPLAGAVAKETPAPYNILGWIQGDAKDYDRAHAVDLAQLRTFLFAT